LGERYSPLHQPPTDDNFISPNQTICRAHHRSQEEGQGHATGHDDGRYDGSGGNGSVGFQNVGTACRKGVVTEQNRTGFVWYHSTQEASAATAGRTRIRVGVPSLRSELATTRSS